MSASTWVLTIMLVLSDGSGTAVLLDHETGNRPEFATRTDCQTVLIQAGEQAGIGTNPKVDWEKSILKCEPKTE